MITSKCPEDLFLLIKAELKKLYKDISIRSTLNDLIKYNFPYRHQTDRIDFIVRDKDKDTSRKIRLVDTGERIIATEYLSRKVPGTILPVASLMDYHFDEPQIKELNLRSSLPITPVS